MSLVKPLSSPTTVELSYNKPIIDIHTHPVFMGDGRSTKEVKALVRRAKRFGIQRMIALGDVLYYGASPSRKQIQTLNNETAKIVSMAPRFFIGFCYLNPTLGERAVRNEVDRCVGGKGFKGLKLEIANNARDACMKPVMEAGEAYDVPVLQHTWSQTKIKKRSFHSDPEDTCLLAKRFPNTRVIMAHLTGCGFRGVLAARGIDNLWVDTSGGSPEAGIVEHAVSNLGSDRVLYGSDLPIRDLPAAIGQVSGSPISSRDKENI
ncbi:MAG: amidohydrolase family protein, partial [Opitutales bacterium]|nr:amidohydrolase family protein [Opitutales bacterium]